jgi:hypothetical protein
MEFEEILEAITEITHALNRRDHGEAVWLLDRLRSEMVYAATVYTIRAKRIDELEDEVSELYEALESLKARKRTKKPAEQAQAQQ